ncbi:hypothetical protein BGZ57DRAFT_900265 [Hyaloscypha finlandica]|nr:hypothetical protein BGZ57DRAFT_900265 [Hyaloscypha finlandica]
MNCNRSVAPSPCLHGTPAGPGSYSSCWLRRRHFFMTCARERQHTYGTGQVRSTVVSTLALFRFVRRARYGYGYSTVAGTVQRPSCLPADLEYCTVCTMYYCMYLSYRQFCVRLAASTAVAPGGPAERHPSFCSSTCISQHAMTLRWAGHCRGGGQNGHWVMGSACGRESQGKARRACFLACLPACLLAWLTSMMAPRRGLHQRGQPSWALRHRVP